jgi:hypothetical protein
MHEWAFCISIGCGIGFALGYFIFERGNQIIIDRMFNVHQRLLDTIMRQSRVMDAMDIKIEELKKDDS